MTDVGGSDKTSGLLHGLSISFNLILQELEFQFVSFHAIYQG